MRSILKLSLAFVLFITFSCKNNANKSDENKSDSSNIEVSNTLEQNESFDFKELPFSKNEINGSLYQGVIFDGKKWQDKNGLNYFFISEKTIEVQKENDETGPQVNTYEIHGYHYTVNTDKFKLVREVKDFQTKCGFALDCGIFNKSLNLTDIDNNNIGEITFVYFLQCASEYSPYTMKLLMLENGEKYAIRGSSYVLYPGEALYGGDTKIDQSFNSAPKSLKDFAVKEWKKFQFQKSGSSEDYKLLEQFKDTKFAGVEPNWTIRFTPVGAEMELVFNDSPIFATYKSIQKSGNTWTIYLKGDQSDEEYLAIIKKENCFDGMSDNKYSYSIKLEHYEAVYQGCCCQK